MIVDKDKLSLAMAKACMTQKDLVNRGVPKNTLLNALKGNNIKPVTAGKIARALSVDVTEIIA